MDKLSNKIDSLIDLHYYLCNHELVLRRDRLDYMKYLIETELKEEGHSLKGIKGLSKKNRGVA